jgi:hypothetical protein
VLGELHRRRMARIQETNNTLLNELIDAIRDDTENRQDVKELIRTIRERNDEKGHYCLLNRRDHLAGRHAVAAGAANQPGSTAEDGEVRGLSQDPVLLPGRRADGGDRLHLKVENRQYAEGEIAERWVND